MPDIKAGWSENVNLRKVRKLGTVLGAEIELSGWVMLFLRFQRACGGHDSQLLGMGILLRHQDRGAPGLIPPKPIVMNRISP